MFRKLYWVTEMVDPLGASHIIGVYTSIPDLIRTGLPESNKPDRLRLTLTKLDSTQPPFGVWCEPDFSCLSERLQDFIATDEFSMEHCQMLVEALRSRTAVTA